MEEHENLYEKIQEIIGTNPGNLKILEQQIDMDLQLEYYECSRRVKEDRDLAWALEHIQYLNESGYSLEVKKEILARLASTGKVESFRALESYLEEGEPSLRHWTLLSLNECRMQLESKIMDENQVYISTGLGGRDEKLRYFVVLISRSRLDLTSSQHMVIKNEFEYVLKKFNAELEEVHFSGYLATILLLMPMNHSLKTVFQDAIHECNLYGDFLHEDFIVTNVKTLSFQEIEDFLERKTDGD